MRNVTLPITILTLDDAVPAFLISDVQSKLAYLDQRLVAANLLEDGKTFEISPATPLDGEVIDELRARIQQMVVTMTEDAFGRGLRLARVFWSHLRSFVTTTRPKHSLNNNLKSETKVLTGNNAPPTAISNLSLSSQSAGRCVNLSTPPSFNDATPVPVRSKASKAGNCRSCALRD
jgi:hypothetical protein